MIGRRSSVPRAAAGSIGTGVESRTAPQAVITWLLVVLLAPIAALAAVAVPAGAQSGELQLVSQTPYVAADGELGLVLRWVGPIEPDLTLSARIFGVITDEAAVTAAPTTDTINRYPAGTERPPLGSLVGENGLITFTIPIRSFEAADARVFLPAEGVYPVVLEVRDSEGPVSTLRTHLIRLPTETTETDPSRTNLVINVSSADGLELREVIPLLERHPSLPVTVLLEEGVIPQLESDPDLNTAFGQALGQRTATAVPVLDLDPSALAEIDRPELYTTALARTNERLTNLGVAVDPAVLPLDTTLTEAGAAMLDELGIDIIIDLAGSAESGGSIAAGQGLRVVTIDERRTIELQRRASDDTTGSDSIQRAHQLIAALAVRRLSDRSPVVLGGAEIRTVEIAALEVVLGALDQPGLIEAVDVRTAANSGLAVPLRLVERPDQNLEPISLDVSTFLTELDTYAQFHVEDGVDPTSLMEGLLASLTRNLNPDERERELARLQASIDDQLEVIDVPDGQSVTLTARSATVPLNIVNNSIGPRTVMLQFESDRIDVAEQGTVIELQPGRTALDIEVETKALGLSPIDVAVLTPDGRHQLASTQYRIRSTAIPGLGYVLSLTALLFLIAWWIVSISRSRAIKAHPSGAVATDSGSVPAESVPAESVPAESVPAESVPAESRRSS